MIFGQNYSDFHFSMPENAPPVTMPINAHSRYRAPVVPREYHALATPKPTPRLPHGTFYNRANPGKLKLR